MKEINGDKNLSPPHSENMLMNHGANEKSGLIWVNGGRIFVQNPVGNAAKATLIPCPEVQILVNGNPVTRETTLTESDIIEVLSTNLSEPGQAKVLVSPDKMSAFIDMKNEYINSFELIDSPPVPKLILRTKSKKELVITQSKESLLELLRISKVNYGIDIVALNELVNNPQDGMTLVAQGLPPGTSTDDYIELFFKQKNTLPLEDHEGKISFKEQSNIQSVSAGEVLAQKILGQVGTPGVNIYNQPCIAREPKKIELLAGPGTEVSDNGLKIIATNDGQPKVKKSSVSLTISVEQVLSIESDVDVKTGNIRFKGNVNINGSVENDMTVSATGNITINNLVTKCTIIAGGDVTVNGNVVNSEVVSGGFLVLCNALKPLLVDLLKILEDLFISATLMAEKLPANSKIIFGNILVLLIEKKFSHFPPLLERTSKKLKDLDLKLLGNFEETLERIILNLTGFNILNFKNASDFQQILHELNKFFYYVDTLTTKRSLVNIKVALNSVVRSSGDVKVSGGLFNTHILAEGKVTVDGIVRGGVVEAKDDVFIKQIGSEMGTKCIVAVSAGNKIKFDHAYDGVTVKVGKASRILDKQMQNIVISLDEEGFLQINISTAGQ